MSKKKEKIRIIKNDSNNEDYTFVKDNIITKVNNIKNNESANNEKKSEKKTDERSEKKIHTTKSHHKGRKTLGKSMQGHSPIYE
jgi:hypothetical protein